MTENNDAEPLSKISPDQFMNIADKFINVANRSNQRVPAVELHMAFLYAAARYSSHVCKNVLEVEDQEQFVSEMTKSYQEMLRNHLADPSV